MKFVLTSKIVTSFNNILSEENITTFKFCLTKSKYTCCAGKWLYQTLLHNLQQKYRIMTCMVGTRRIKYYLRLGNQIYSHVTMAKITYGHSTDEFQYTQHHIFLPDCILYLTEFKGQFRIEFGFTETITDIKPVLHRLKEIYQFATEPLSVLPRTEYESLTREYNQLWNKKTRTTPWIVPQSWFYLSTTVLSETDWSKKYVLLPPPKGNRCRLWIHRGKVRLLHSEQIFTVENFTLSKITAINEETKTEVPDEHKWYDITNTILLGYWYENIFTAWDIAMFNGRDICSKTYLFRRKKLSYIYDLVSETVFFEIAPIETDMTQLVNWIEKYDGVMLLKERANFKTKHVYIYRTKCDIYTKLKPRHADYTTYQLIIYDNEVVKIEDKQVSIPITRTNRECLTSNNDTIYELRWICGKWVPLRALNYGVVFTSTKRDIMQTWNYLNDLPTVEKIIENMNILF